MSHTTDALSLAPLEDAYQIVGELGGREHAQAFLAKRRLDGADVLIVVVRAPESDEGHALTQLAADTRLLAACPHPNLIPILDGIWLGTSAFCVITKRVAEPTLSERLALGERFSNPRIAEILHEVNGLLVWAREQKVVHRLVTAKTIVLEHGTGRPLVSFAVAPGHRARLIDPEPDAVAIAALAWMLFAGTVAPTDRNDKALTEARPDLPQRVVKETEALLWPTGRRETPPDVPAYLAIIAMADPLMIGEANAAQVLAASVEEQRKAREQLDLERRTWEQQATETRQKLAEDQAAFERKMAEDQAAFERAMADDRLAFGRAMEVERAEVERALAADREEFERVSATERAALATHRARVERQLAKEREALDTQRELLVRAAAKEAGALEEALRARELMEDAESVTADEDAIEEAAALEPAVIGEAGYDQPNVADGGGEVAAVDPGRSRLGRWALVGSAVVLVAIIVASAVGIGRHPAPTVAFPLDSIILAGPPTARPPVATSALTGAIADSSNGSVTAPDTSVAHNVVRPDSVREKIARQDSVREKVARQDSVREKVARQDSVREKAARPDSGRGKVVHPDSGRDTVARRDSIVKPKPDTGSTRRMR